VGVKSRRPTVRDHVRSLIRTMAPRPVDFFSGDPLSSTARAGSVGCPDSSEDHDGCDKRIYSLWVSKSLSAAVGSWTRSLQWETQRTWFRSAGATTGCPPAKVSGVWPSNEA
jgi:hypothetical protein